jgi:hypothetical protein
MLSVTRISLAIFLLGCSSSGGGLAPDATAPTTTTGGAGGGTGAASQGALSLYLSSATTPGAACPAFSHWVNVPFATQGGQQTSASAKGPIGVDGKDQIVISCTVKQASGGFDVSASLTSPTIDPATGSPGNPTSVALSTSIAAGQSAQGSLSVMDDKTAVSYASVDQTGVRGPTCTFSVQPSQPGDQLGVAAGRIWASVMCPMFKDPASSIPDEICAIRQGYFVLENCSR